ncbi:ribosomal-processing cysteine protease Prp [Butyrivibrio sp. MC2013]|uniref:ribosomal-processing cysteine protease Prp n=1 Tax=Butyrivibrio sp. MC2013 TaxID=1280686 RepID=UPI0003F5284C|nr:ribosomal-processing cysteine protease Prp [Butyrivibrio sp. MC2013]
MTDITIIKDSSGSYKGFICHGHAGFADYGDDIVCSAISVLTINTINSINEFTSDQMDVSQDEEEGLITCFFKDGISHDSEILMKSYELGINGIYRQYGEEFLNIKFEEV